MEKPSDRISGGFNSQAKKAAKNLSTFYLSYSYSESCRNVFNRTVALQGAFIDIQYRQRSNMTE